MSVFSSLDPKIQEALAKIGFTTPTEPQEKTIPVVLGGNMFCL